MTRPQLYGRTGNSSYERRNGVRETIQNETGNYDESNMKIGYISAKV